MIETGTLGQDKYTTGLIKGSGLVDETLSLLDLWEPGMNGRRLADLAVEKNVISKATATRTKDIVREFSRRYLLEGGKLATYLKKLAQSSVSLNRLKQLFMVYTARTHPILRDFIVNVYWDGVRNNHGYLEHRDANRFLEQALLNENIEIRWTDEVIKKISTRLLTCLRDFDFISADATLKRRIVPYSILPFTAMFISHEIHFSGFSDNSILESPDWALFGIFGKADVVNVLKQASTDEVFILQYSGDLLRISWKHDTMEELLNAITGREL